jgi:hypothetical protein
LVLFPRTVRFAGSRLGMTALRKPEGQNEQGNGCYGRKRFFHFSETLLLKIFDLAF